MQNIKYLPLHYYIFTLSLFTLSKTQECNFTTQVLYEGSCLTRICLTDNIARMELLSSSDNFTYVTELVNQNGKTQYHITISYPDQQINQLVQIPNCIDWRLYQIQNSDSINNVRNYINQPASIPSWPMSHYFFNETSQMVQIDFYMNQDDLTLRGCVLTQQSMISNWECYFEFAFLVNNQTQISHFFDISVRLDHNTGNQGNHAINIQRRKTTIVDNCQLGDPSCTLEIQIESNLMFCQDRNCFITSNLPYNMLYVNQEFFVKHSIEDLNFKSNWVITDTQIEYHSNDLQLILNAANLNIITSKPGYNIYQLSVPIVSSNVLIIAKGSISQQNQRVLTTSNGFNTVQAQQNTGPINQPQTDQTIISNYVTNEKLDYSFAKLLILGVTIMKLLII